MMTVKKAYRCDDVPIVRFVIDTSDAPVFTALRNWAGIWKHVPVTVGDLENDFSLILDYAEVECLVVEARYAMGEPVKNRS